MKINKKVLLMALLLGLVTAIVLYYYMSSLGEPGAAELTYTEVVVAQSTIPAHVRITAEMVGTESVITEAVHPEAVRSLDAVVGKVTRTEIIRGEQIIAGRVVMDEMQATLAYRIPENMRAIAIPVGEITGVSGYISPGDRVDVLVSYDDEDINDSLITYTVLQNLVVLTVGEETNPRDTQERGLASSLTLLVTPAQAEVLAYANLTGSFHLTLRIPTDTAIVDLGSYSSENFETFRER